MKIPQKRLMIMPCIAMAQSRVERKNEIRNHFAPNYDEFLTFRAVRLNRNWEKSQSLPPSHEIVAIVKKTIISTTPTNYYRSLRPLNQSFSTLFSQKPCNYIFDVAVNKEWNTYNNENASPLKNNIQSKQSKYDLTLIEP